MRSRVPSVVALMVGLLLLASCSSDGSSAGAANQTASTVPSTASTTTTTAPTTTTIPIVPVGTPTEAANAFITAWRNGDPVAASSIATAAAVQTAFGGGEPGHVENRGCNSPPVDGPVLCVYRTDPGELQLRIQPTPAGWFVDQAILSPA
jgi:hypothetical protein